MKQTPNRSIKHPYFRKRYHPPGTAPGTLTTATTQPSECLPNIRLIDYSADNILIHEAASPHDCLSYLERKSVTWVHIQGRLPAETMRALGETFHLHPLAMEDVLNTGQRPKIEPFEKQSFIIMNLPVLHENGMIIHQVSLFATAHYIVSFCESEDDLFAPLIHRLNNQGTSLLKRGTDFLLYAILDLVIDQGFPILENLGLQLEELEDNIAESAGHETLERMHALKRELVLLRRILWPQREVITQLLREDHDLITEGTRIYLRDCYDHTVEIIELLEAYRDMAGSLLDVYLSSVSNRLNETMRVLAVISTIFIPMTFVAGIYGMNFDRASPWNMPELGWLYGYPMFWLIITAIAIGMALFFKRRGWF